MTAPCFCRQAPRKPLCRIWYKCCTTLDQQYFPHTMTFQNKIEHQGHQGNCRVCAPSYTRPISHGESRGKGIGGGAGGTSGWWQWLRCQLELAKAGPRSHNQPDGKANSWLALQILRTVYLPSFLKVSPYVITFFLSFSETRY